MGWQPLNNILLLFSLTFSFLYEFYLKTKYSECPKSEYLVWETKQKMVWISARSNFRRLGRSVCSVRSVLKDRPFCIYFFPL